jgi:hypothetical protein
MINTKLALKEGEKLTLKIGNCRGEPKERQMSSVSVGSGILRLNPPGVLSPPRILTSVLDKTETEAPVHRRDDDDWGDFVTSNNK